MTVRLNTKQADELSNLINQMLLGMESRRSAEERVPRNEADVKYWYQYQLNAERQLQALGIHLSAPLE
jgi:hypothetical protein